LTSEPTRPDATGVDAPPRPRAGHPTAAWVGAAITCLAFLSVSDAFWSRAVYLLGVTGATVALVVASRRREHLAAWRWVAAGLAVNTTADWIFSIPKLTESDAFFWHATDLVYFAAYCCFVRGLLLLARNRERTSVIDRLIELWSIVAVVGLVAWFVVVQPVIDTEGSVAERLLAVGYPFFAMFLVGMTIWTFLVRGHRAEPGLAVLGAGLTTWLLADIGHSVWAVSEALDGEPTKLLDLGWLAGGLVIALGGLRASTAPPRAQVLSPRRAGWARVATGATLILIPMVVHAVRDVNEGHGWPWPSTITAAVLTGLSVWRTVRLRGESDRAWQLLRARERRAQALAENSSDAVLIVDTEGRLLHGREDALRLLGSGAAIDLGEPAWDLIHEADRSKAVEVLGRCAELPGRPISTELRVSVGGEPPRWFSFRAINLMDDPDVGGLVVNVHNIDDRKRAERELQHRATHDALTGLPNRALFRERVRDTLEHGEATAEPCAVLFIDLDGFKAVNDSLGHEAGDQLLRVIAERLRTVTPPRHMVARLGGDEFAVLLEDGADLEAEGAALAVAILDALGDEVSILGQQLHPRASIGVARSSAGEDAATLLRHADLAMYGAKARGRGRWQAFEPPMETELSERLRIEHDLGNAVENGQLRLEYQPIVQLATGRLRGFEALLRWEHPTLGRLGPDRFIPEAEATGLVVAIGAWVLERAVGVMARWREELPHDPPLTMAVNVSAKQLVDPGFVDFVREVVARHRIDPQLLVLELTETSLISQPDLVASRMEELREVGVRLAIDDFGTGFSSLNHLRRFPVDVMKIDREFTSLIEDPDDVPAIVRALLDLSRTLGLEVVAEGVETEEQMEGLRAQHCAAGQGYYFARPLDEKAAETLLARSYSPSAIRGGRSSGALSGSEPTASASHSEDRVRSN